MPQIWANYLLQATLTSVASSTGWVNVGDVLQRRGSDVQSTVVDVLPAPDGPADPIQEANPGDAVTIDQPPTTLMSGELVNWIWIA
jgi:hypothetical protein